ncbi:hypothetical protein BCR36DRAFT_583050 [Piromyces finnis]|uniref:CBM10 domain-containing protein n=1 Tax=Piromyces finnis TaxID=1754191 RepID=A0A1Y1VB35_9FUNG|nr:hypothetical protein BCR36DRAFT_583050 [Piromyces finnis]|eukprot:ORX51505.1 hypothetical protein BCR36DRAFT_583050 [Piromyces finnis]
MNIKNFIFLLSIIFTFLIKESHSKSINNVIPKNGEFYLIFVRNENNLIKNSKEYNNYVDSIIESIHKVIIENINTYKNPSEIDNLQNEYEQNKDDYFYDYGKYGGIIYPTFSQNNKIVLYAYLNSNIVGKVESIENIISVNKDNVSVTEDDPIIIEESINCIAKSLGYQCCPKNISEVYYHDENGDWGFDFETNQWCGLSQVGENNNICWSESYGFSCCTGCVENTYSDSYGIWGIENDNWCGVNKNC